MTHDDSCSICNAYDAADSALETAFTIGDDDDIAHAGRVFSAAQVAWITHIESLRALAAA